MDSLNKGRPYRSKRRRPCDVCRRRKHACRLDGDPPCSICRTLGTSCTFNDPPRKRRREGKETSIPVGEGVNGYHDEPVFPSWPLDESPDSLALLSNPSLDLFQDLELSDPGHQGLFPSHCGFWTTPAGVLDGSLDVVPSGPSLGMDRIGTGIGERSPVPDPPKDPARSLDEMEGYSAQYFGLSGAMDPFVLRHFRFADEDTCRFLKVHYRRLQTPSGRDESYQIPVQFMISADDIAEASGSTDVTSINIDSIISPEIGGRLVSLFLRFVFPSLPVLSRTRLGIKSETLIPQPSNLQATPTYLRAAIYALAVPFGRYDPVLCISNVYNRIPTAQLWRIAHQGLFQDVHTPRLSVLQTLLLYLQKPPDSTATAAADPPSRWGLLGYAVNLATALGLHVDCASWALPAWEKRLRRRLWWIVYSEATWRSLVLGFPHPIHEDEWSVAPLDNGDFCIDGLSCPSEELSLPGRPVTCAFCHEGLDFKYLAGLAMVANEVYATFYTLKATRRFVGDFAASWDKARELLGKLDAWRETAPVSIRGDVDGDMQGKGRTKNTIHCDSSAYLRLAFFTLRVLVYRAVFRVDRDGSGLGSGSTDTLESEAWTQGVTLLEQILCYTEGLTSHDGNSFWYSWTRSCFVTISNFVLLLLLQAPTAEKASIMKDKLTRWMRTLRDQSALFEYMHMGLLRLDAMVYAGFERVVCCPAVVEDVLRDRPYNAPSPVTS